MPIDLKNFSCEQLCTGHTLSVRDRSKLVEVLAHVLLGRYLHAKRILETFGGAARPHLSEKDAVLEKLTANETWQAWHRDGWLFQGLSWIASQMRNTGHYQTSVPHTQPAFKGLDTLTIKFDDQGEEIAFIVIGEDKATENARDTIRDEVWPSLKTFEDGTRNSEIISNVTSLLEQKGLCADKVMKGIEDVFWLDQKRYHVAITIKETHDSDQGRKRLFSDFDQVVPGLAARRTATTVRFDDLRGWMEVLATDLKNYILAL